ncbi:MAG: HDOD domain-containing protein [Chloroflexi bacterium]|nr:HDOD domain-containing protein [Chloroflexota bacterium]
MTSSANLELPALPAPRARALLLLTNEASEVAAIAATIESDPALTIAVLQAANSAASAPRQRIETAQDAIVRIGLNPTRQIMTGAVVGDIFRNLERAQIDVDAMWRYLLATAMITEAIATAAPVRTGSAGKATTAGGAFTAGLLHDVGRLALATSHADRYADVVTQARAGLDVMTAERELLGEDHASHGYRIAEQWLLPEEVAEVVLDHHLGQASTLSAAVFQARRIARALGLGNGVETAAAPQLDPGSEDAAIVRRLHGPRALVARIEWYRGAIQPGQPA